MMLLGMNVSTPFISKITICRYYLVSKLIKKAIIMVNEYFSTKKICHCNNVIEPIKLICVLFDYEDRFVKSLQL